MLQQTSNPKLYRELSAPFADKTAAQNAIEAFINEMEVARAKHKIADIISVIQVNCLDETGEEGVMTLSMGFGDPLKKPVMLAQALGKEQTTIEATIARYLAQKR